MPTTRAVGITFWSSPWAATACSASSRRSWSEMTTSSSSSSPTSLLLIVSSSMISVDGFFHLLFGNSSTTTVSPLKLRFKFSLPKTSSGLGIDGTEMEPSRKLYDEMLIVPWYRVPFLIPPIRRAGE
ncbi:hypothetical protein OGATHE_000065 [Ogataea polymorpha]|uniref:Uncharacterized protein n=1 Tax=Ogataea polymorpha TaxID=460523 RepID=A0A9P8THA2_9ASCO|nr:hypothetical protein OGATHE_000065 [Ogataea polymorpha]